MNNKYDKDSLLEIGFEELAVWRLKNDHLVFEPLKASPEYEAVAAVPNVLYAFATEQTVHYIGKTTRSIRQRFAGYSNPGATQQTNKKCEQKLRELLNADKQVSILVFTSDGPLRYGEFSINLAAGLEDSLIDAFEPAWNGTQKGTSVQTETYANEEAAEISPSDPNPPIVLRSASGDISRESWCDLPSFTVNLSCRAYWQDGFLNVPQSRDKFVGKHDDSMLLHFGTPDSEPLARKINRKAQSNGTARIYGGTNLARWFQNNFSRADKATVYILNPNELFVPGRNSITR